MPWGAGSRPAGGSAWAISSASRRRLDPGAPMRRDPAQRGSDRTGMSRDYYGPAGGAMTCGAEPKERHLREHSREGLEPESRRRHVVERLARSVVLVVF